MKEASFYEIKELIHCSLCPHRCVLNNEDIGRCGARKVIDGKLYSLNYGEISSIFIDPIEKKPIANWMQGSKVLSIGSFGCNFNCDFCQNYNISIQQPRTRLMRPEDIVQHAFFRNIPSIAYTYNEPTVFYEMMYDTSIIAHDFGINNIMVTNGFIQKKPLEKILPYIDAMNIDLKTYNDINYKKIGGSTVDIILDNISIASNYCHVEVTLLIVPEINDSIEDLEILFKRLYSIKNDLTLHITRYFPQYQYSEPATNILLMMDIHKRALKYFKNVYLGNVR